MLPQNTGKEELIDMIFCAILMSAIDHDIHNEEWNRIQVFIKQNWKKEYGDFYPHKKQIVTELKQLMKNDDLMKKKLNTLLSNLKDKLHQFQKNQLLQLVSDVMAADNVMSPEESDLFAVFLKNLGVQNQ